MATAASIDTLGAVHEDVGEIGQPSGRSSSSLTSTGYIGHIASTCLQQLLGNCSELVSLVVFVRHQVAMCLGSVPLSIIIIDNP